MESGLNPVNGRGEKIDVIFDFYVIPFMIIAAFFVVLFTLIIHQAIEKWRINQIEKIDVYRNYTEDN